jgi:predicted RNA binding protein YcfA (HicA-like mRNA interferase family)
MRPTGVAPVAWPVASVYSTHVKSHDLVREVEAAGWRLDRTRGSHQVFKHPDRPGIVVIPHPQKDLGKGLVSAIRRQAGLKE